MVHLVFEALAYTAGFALYRWLRRRRGDFLSDEHRWSMIVAVVLGAAVGSKLLHHLNQPALLAEHWNEPGFLLGGKTIVGALLGGWLAVEATKKALGIRRATGDLYVLPLAVGIAIGRVGCHLAGLSDGTYGVASTLPWAIDFGDGVPRHPTQLYEVVYVLLLALVLARWRPRREGDSFKVFLAAYLAFRLAVDGLKPGEPLAGLSAIQWAALAGLLFYAWTIAHARRGTRTEGVAAGSAES